MAPRPPPAPPRRRASPASPGPTRRPAAPRRRPPRRRPAHCHRVVARHQAAVVGEVTLDQRGQQDVAHRDRPARDDRAGEQHRRPVEDAHENARRECRHHPGQHRFDAEPMEPAAARRSRAGRNTAPERWSALPRRRPTTEDPPAARAAPARPRRPRAVGWSRRAPRTAPAARGAASPSPYPARRRRDPVVSPRCHTHPRAVRPCRNAQLPVFANSPRRYSTLVRTSETGPSPDGSPGRIVSCSRTYHPS